MSARLSLWSLLAALTAGALASCDSAAPPGATGSITVDLTYPDGTPIVGDVVIRQEADASGNPVGAMPYVRSEQTTAGPVTFEDVPEGTYMVTGEGTSPIGPGLQFGGDYRETVRVDGEVTVHAYAGVGTVDNPSTLGPGSPAVFQSVQSSATSPVSGNPTGRATLYRYNLARLHVGDRHDLVTRVVPLDPFYFYSDSGAGLTVSVYRIPDSVAWPSEALTYEVFDSLVPEATYAVEYRPNESSSTTGEYTGCARPVLAPGFFFGARNGFAVVFRDDGRGEGVPVPPSIGPLVIEYPWEGDRSEGPVRADECFGGF
ncbi:MAG TPA: hypothetical protein VF576_08370 [Rubricoccaceae bacterium]